MEYIIICAAYNQIIDVETDNDAIKASKGICTKSSDNVFVVKYKDLIRD
jgi:hypothetical protein